MVRIKRAIKSNCPNINTGKPILDIDIKLREFFNKFCGSVCVDRYLPLDNSIFALTTINPNNIACTVSDFDDEYFYIHKILMTDIFEIENDVVKNYSVGIIYCVDKNIISCQQILKLYLIKISEDDQNDTRYV